MLHSAQKATDPKGSEVEWLAGWKQDSLMVRNGATFDHQSDEILGVAWIENPIHNRPQATVLGDMALQRCWHPRVKDPVAHRRKEAAEVREIKGVLRIFDLPIGQPAVQMDRNLIHLVERTMRPIALGRKNALFAGSDSGARTWAILASLINTAKLNDLDPHTYLVDELERMISGRTPVNRLDELLAWNWKAARDALATAAA